MSKNPKSYLKHQKDLRYKKKALEANEKNIFKKKHMSAAHAGLLASMEDSDQQSSVERPKYQATQDVTTSIIETPANQKKGELTVTPGVDFSTAGATHEGFQNGENVVERKTKVQFDIKTEATPINIA